ncbi:MAG: RelA/SpoT family protein, partial [Candidatus Porifericomitaceae bacterium WSBS_2022_MAG_OTU9]
MTDHFQTLRITVSPYLPPEQIEEIHRAYLFGREAHLNQTRRSGGPFIKHPIEVGCILGRMHMDYKTIIAAILHDTIEDTDTAREDIRVHFGEEVEQLVVGVTKIGKIPSQNYASAQAGNLCKMLLAMTDDIRVILIKLSDRLHNMKTLDAMPQEKRQLISRETIDIYAPIALRLGMNKMRLELEELSFRHAYPWRHKVLSRHLQQARRHGKHLISRIRASLERRLKKENIEAGVVGREKHLYGVYAKMRRKKAPLREISDLHAFRIITSNIQECYLALGAVHSTYKPLPGKFKDYIAIPKSNGYQSLHTVLFGPQGLPIEVQIRSEEMEAVAESGIAAHWLYKSDPAAPPPNQHQKLLHEWMHNVMELQEESGGPEEFVENLKVDLFPDEVFVFTPNGDIIKLPRGATVLDLAYAIHTDLGHHCSGAHIENRRASMRQTLRSGQTVEVLTSPLTYPYPEWLDIAVTARARSRIRQYLKTLRVDTARKLGKELLERELTTFGKQLP